MYKIVKDKEQIIEKIKSAISAEEGAIVRLDYNDYNIILSGCAECQLLAMQGVRKSIVAEENAAMAECDASNVKKAVVRLATSKNVDLEYDEVMTILDALTAHYEGVDIIWGCVYDNRLYDDEASVMVLLG